MQCKEANTVAFLSKLPPMSRRSGKGTGTDPVGGEERKGHEESTRLEDLGEARAAAVLEAEEGATVQRDKEQAEPWKKGRGGERGVFSSVGERPHRRRRRRSQENPNRVGREKKIF
ncbi:hypothetical protein Bca4012_047278 [Brassica carinata]